MKLLVVSILLISLILQTKATYTIKDLPQLPTDELDDGTLIQVTETTKTGLDKQLTKTHYTVKTDSK